MIHLGLCQFCSILNKPLGILNYEKGIINAGPWSFGYPYVFILFKKI